MKNKFISIIIFVLLTCVSVANVHAYTNDGGITIDTNKAKFYTDYTLTSTDYIYNESGGTGTTAGWVSIRSAKTRTIQYILTDVVGITTLYFEGTLIGQTSPSEIYTVVKGTATSGFIPIAEDVDEVRVGAKVDAPGSSAKIKIWGKFPGI